MAVWWCVCFNNVLGAYVQRFAFSLRVVTHMPFQFHRLTKALGPEPGRQKPNVGAHSLSLVGFEAFIEYKKLVQFGDKLVQEKLVLWWTIYELD